MSRSNVLSDEGEAAESQLMLEPPPADGLQPSFWQLLPDTQPQTTSQQIGPFDGTISSSLPAPLVPFSYGTAPENDAYLPSTPGSPIPERCVLGRVLWSFFVPAAAPVPTSSTSVSISAAEKKRQRSSYQHIVPFGDPVFVSLLQSLTLADFKAYVIVVLEKKHENLGKQADQLNAAGQFKWIGFIDRDAVFAIGKNHELVNDAGFEAFRTAAAKGRGKKIGIRLTMDDPSKGNQVSDEIAAMKKALALAQGPFLERQVLQQEVDRVAANGHADCDEVLTLAAKLTEDHKNVDDRFPAETAVVVRPPEGPNDPVQYIELSYRLAVEWAEKIHADRGREDGVTEHKMPNSKGFRSWKTYRPAKSVPEPPAVLPDPALVAPNTGAISGAVPFPFCGFNPFLNLGQPVPGIPTGNVLQQPNQQGSNGWTAPNLLPGPIESSPTPEAESPLQDFLTFARVDYEDPGFKEVIVVHQIKHYFFFENCTVEELVNLGFVMGYAKLLFRASKLYSSHLKAMAKKA